MVEVPSVGFSFGGTSSLLLHHMEHLNLLLFDNASAVRQKAAHVCFLEALAPTETHRHSGYETNLNLVGVAGHLDFNGHLPARFVARSKDTVNPNAILAPGKPGIWPKKYRA